jgi:hypothetical protein
METLNIWMREKNIGRRKKIKGIKKERRYEGRI